MRATLSMRFATLVLFSLLTLVTTGFAQTYRPAGKSAIDTVPAWFPVGFCLLIGGVVVRGKDLPAQHVLHVR